MRHNSCNFMILVDNKVGVKTLALSDKETLGL